MNRKHGMHDTRTYKSWSEMKQRCHHPEGRTGHYEGITYCEEWEHYEGFLRDMGVRPEGMSLDRINVYEGYSPGNCRWADRITQQNNRRNNIYYDIDGEKLTLPQVARRYGVNKGALRYRIYKKHQSITAALSHFLGRCC